MMMKIAWLLMWLNMSIAILNATLQLLVIYRLVFLLPSPLKLSLPFTFSNNTTNQWIFIFGILLEFLQFKVIIIILIFFKKKLSLFLNIETL